MNQLDNKRKNAYRRANRVRTIIKGTADRPRLSVNVSNLHLTAQVIDDSSGKTVAYATTVGQKISGTMSERAAWVGEQIAKKSLKAKVSKVVFDRGSRKYHGRIKNLADAARKNGLEF